MGVPIVGLSYNSKFSGLFDQLGLPPRLLLLDEFPARWGMNELVDEAEAALDGASDLRHRAEQLGDISRERTIEVVFGSVDALVAGTADA
jgi:polysaccharide pyruvyl transferase WcaK-like protein